MISNRIPRFCLSTIKNSQLFRPVLSNCSPSKAYCTGTEKKPTIPGKIGQCSLIRVPPPDNQTTLYMTNLPNYGFLDLLVNYSVKIVKHHFLNNRGNKRRTHISTTTSSFIFGSNYLEVIWKHQR